MLHLAHKINETGVYLFILDIKMRAILFRMRVILTNDQDIVQKV